MIELLPSHRLAPFALGGEPKERSGRRVGRRHLVLEEDGVVVGHDEPALLRLLPHESVELLELADLRLHLVVLEGEPDVREETHVVIPVRLLPLLNLRLELDRPLLKGLELVCREEAKELVQLLLVAQEAVEDRLQVVNLRLEEPALLCVALPFRSELFLVVGTARVVADRETDHGADDEDHERRDPGGDPASDSREVLARVADDPEKGQSDHEHDVSPKPRLDRVKSLGRAPPDVPRQVVEEADQVFASLVAPAVRVTPIDLSENPEHCKVLPFSFQKVIPAFAPAIPQERSYELLRESYKLSHDLCEKSMLPYTHAYPQRLFSALTF